MLPKQFFAAPALSCSICVSLWASTETGAVFVCTLPQHVLPVAPDFCFCVAYMCYLCAEQVLLFCCLLQQVFRVMNFLDIPNCEK
jgi:hypothetical protein